MSKNRKKITPRKKLKIRPKSKNKSFAQRFLQRLIENPREDVYIDGKPTKEIDSNVFEE